MVALVESALNESYVEPSPYAWLRSRTPVPTSYASACDPLYPFQDVLENRTSRARCMTGSCAEAPGRKCQICIEIWQFELESCVWRVSFHKYAYVHGDPIQGVDPTGMFFSVGGVLAGIAIGTGISMFTSMGVEMLHSANKDHAWGIGGYDATHALGELRRMVIQSWNTYDKAAKERVIDTLHSWNPWTSVVVGWDVKEMKFGYKKLWRGGMNFFGLDNTLTYNGFVYAIADVNYVFWGLLHGLADRDGIRPLYSGLEGTTAPVLAYRLVLGGAVYLGTSAKWDAFESMEGKLAWAMFGWSWAKDRTATMDNRVALLRGSPNSSIWPYALNAGVGNYVFAVGTTGTNAPEP